MIAQYDKVIVIKEGEIKKSVVIFDEETHLPVFYGLTKFGMDEVADAINWDNGIIPKQQIDGQ